MLIKDMSLKLSRKHIGKGIPVIKSEIQARKYLKPYSATNILAKPLYTVLSAYILKYKSKESNIVFSFFFHRLSCPFN